MNRGLVHIYTGGGKGKTTAAIGLLVRASGAGMKTVFCQFMKGRETSELEPLRSLGVEVFRTDEVKKFVPYMNDHEKKECVKSHQLCYNKVKDKIRSGEYGLVVLDEVMSALAYGFIDLGDLCLLVQERPPQTELILTGRNAPEELVSLSDYVSEIQEIKHPYQRGIPARKGIEY